MPQLSDSQLVVLTAACQRPDRCVFPITAKLKGNAAGNVLKSLLKNGLINEVQAKSKDDTVWRHDEERGRMTLVATPAAFAALGIDVADEAAEPKRDVAAPAPVAKAASAPKGRRPTKSPEPTERRTRANTKQAKLIAMLQRPRGATIDELAEVLDWQPHTVRGAIAGALKKKLGLEVTSEKDEKRGRIYRLVS
jgi:hypothetical protein